MRNKILLRIIIFIVVFMCILLWMSANYLVVTEYSISEDIKGVIRIVQLTDLHNKEFGKENRKLIAKILEQAPDLIFMTGDMINKDEDLDVICNLIHELAKKIPVYYSYGNAEKEWKRGTANELRQKLECAGAIVLDCEYIDLEVNGEEIRIGGYYGYYRTPHMHTTDKEEQEKEILFADKFEKTDEFKILLAHIPTTWLDWEYRNEFPIDLIFCGHYHGGQIRIPFVGGVYVPYVGWFPKYSKGLFEGKIGICVLSAGLGNEQIIPRVNNLPEIVTIEMRPLE